MSSCWPERGIRILHVEDSPEDQLLVRETVREYLGARVELVNADMLAQGLAELERGGFDIVLLDLGLPDGEGLDLIRRMAAVPPGYPIVALSGSTSTHAALDAVSAGAQDFVNKGELRHPGVLARAMRYALERHSMRKALERRSEELAENLAASEARFRNLIEGSRDGFLVLASDRIVLYANPAARRLLGVPRDGPVVWGHEVPERDRAEIELLDREREPRSAEVACWKTIWQGSDAWVLTLRDLTERKRAAKELKDKEEQLIQAQKLEALGSLAGGVAHDFNNLLGVIMGYAGLIEQTLPDDSAILSDLTEIREAARRAAALTRQLLAFSRREEVRPVVLDLNQVVADMQKLLGRTIGENIDLTVQYERELWRVKADPARIEQVLLNLAVNARDAMPQGGNLRIETRNVDIDSEQAARAVDLKPGRYAQIEVSDTGAGMSKEVQQCIFEPFFTTKPKDKGTGLGLATVYGIVKQAGGRIQVYSELGTGTTFRVYLPATQEQGATPLPPDVTKLLRGSGQTVLVVEDEDGLRSYIERVLARSGYRVLVAKDVQEAMSQAGDAEPPPDVVLTDVVLPGGHGQDLVEDLREHLPGIKAVFMSGYTDSVITYHKLVQDGVDLLRKPFTEREVLAKLHEVLSGKDRGDVD